jgi:hypothetical protein
VIVEGERAARREAARDGTQKRVLADTIATHKADNLAGIDEQGDTP